MRRALLALLAAGLLIIAACANQPTGQAPSDNQQPAATENAPPSNPAPNNAQPPAANASANGRFGSRFGNLTSEQRQQIAAAMSAACEGKAAGDACTAQTPMGERNGTCMERNSTIICRTGGQRSFGQQ
jgi:hypothetical protein